MPWPPGGMPRYTGDDYDLISPEARVVIRRLFDYRSSTLKFWWPPGFKKDWPELIGGTRKMNRIADDAYLQLGRRYDYLGLIGQALRGLASRLGLPGFGNWLAGVFQRPSRWFCSEMVAYCYQRQFPDFCNGNKHPSPQDIDDWCVKNRLGKHDREGQSGRSRPGVRGAGRGVAVPPPARRANAGPRPKTATPKGKS